MGKRTCVAIQATKTSTSLLNYVFMNAKKTKSKVADGKNDGRFRFIAFSVLLVIVLLVLAAAVLNRGLQIETTKDSVKATLEPAKQPDPPLSTQNDGSPIVTGQDAHVESKVTGGSRAAPLQHPPSSGMATTGAASPIVTGKGAVVTTTVESRP